MEDHDRATRAAHGVEIDGPAVLVGQPNVGKALTHGRAELAVVRDGDRVRGAGHESGSIAAGNARAVQGIPAGRLTE